MLRQGRTVLERRTAWRWIVSIAGMLGVLSLSALPLAPAGAMTIDVTYGSGVTGDMQTAMNAIVSAYDAAFANNITLYIGLEGSSDISGLGESSSLMGTLSYGAWYSQMQAFDTSTLTNATFQTGFASLPSSSVLGTSGSVSAKAAELTALGLNVNLGGAPNISTGTGLDGVITINTGYPLAIPSSDTMPSGSYDLVSVMEHELNEVLGIGSGLTDGTYPATPEAYDYFRYSAPGTRTFSPTGSAYFSIDGGVTNLANFNQNPAGDYNDWANGSCPAHIPLPQNAFDCPNQVMTLMENATTPDPELIALDALGYDLSNTAPLLALDTSQTQVPEPATFALLAPILLCLARWRRRPA